MPDFSGSLRIMAVALPASASVCRRPGSLWPHLVVASHTRTSCRWSVRRYWRWTCTTTGAEQGQNQGSQCRRTGHQRRRQTVSLKDQQKRILRIPLETGYGHGPDRRCRCTSKSPLMWLDRTLPAAIAGTHAAPKRQQTTPSAPATRWRSGQQRAERFLRQSVNATLSVSDKAPIDVRGAARPVDLPLRFVPKQTTSTAYPHASS